MPGNQQEHCYASKARFKWPPLRPSAVYDLASSFLSFKNPTRKNVKVSTIENIVLKS